MRKAYHAVLGQSLTRTAVFGPKNNPLRKVPMLTSFYEGGSQGIERLNNFPKMRGRVWIQIQNIAVSLIHCWATCHLVWSLLTEFREGEEQLSKIVKEAHFHLSTTTSAFLSAFFSLFLMACFMFWLIFSTSLSPFLLFSLPPHPTPPFSKT